MKHTPVKIFENDLQPDAQDKAGQIRHLAMIGLAGQSSTYRLFDREAVNVSLFEVIAQLAHELDEMIEEGQE